MPTFLKTLLVISGLFALASCSLKTQDAGPKIGATFTEIRWPAWQPTRYHGTDTAKASPYSPNFIPLPPGEVVTYGPDLDGREHFAVLSDREQNAKAGLYQLRLTLLPTSIFAGRSPLAPSNNTLRSRDFAWTYSAYHFRSTFFDLLPALTANPKGLLVYHTSIMLLSSAEKRIVERFRKLGWNILVALPPDTLYRTKIPTLNSPEGTLESAAALVAEDMDRHYLEQAQSVRVALAYLAKTRPTWLSGRRVLMGTSAGTFGLPATALLNPGWDSLVFISGGTNLLSLYESDSGKAFSNSLKWLDDARRNPPSSVTRIFTNQEYHHIFRQAAGQTRFHSGALAPQLRGQRILTIAGTIDHIMPDEQALGLHRALGSPERWTAPLGHHLIALKLILEVDRIDRWLCAPDFAKSGR